MVRGVDVFMTRVAAQERLSLIANGPSGFISPKGGNKSVALGYGKNGQTGESQKGTMGSSLQQFLKFDKRDSQTQRPSTNFQMVANGKNNNQNKNGAGMFGMHKQSAAYLNQSAIGSGDNFVTNHSNNLWDTDEGMVDARGTMRNMQANEQPFTQNFDMMHAQLQ